MESSIENNMGKTKQTNKKNPENIPPVDPHSPNPPNVQIQPSKETKQIPSLPKLGKQPRSQYSDLKNLIEEFDNPSKKSYVFSIKQNKDRVLANKNTSSLKTLIKKKQSRLQKHKLAKFRDGEFGLLSFQIGAVAALLIGHSICAVDNCLSVFCHDIYGSVGANLRNDHAVIEDFSFINEEDAETVFVEKIEEFEREKKKKEENGVITSKISYDDSKSAGGEFSKHRKNKHADLKQDDKPDEKADQRGPMFIKPGSNQDVSDEVSDYDKTRIEQLWNLFWVSTGLGYRASDNKVIRKLVDKLHEVSNKTVSMIPSMLVPGRTKTRKTLDPMAERVHEFHKNMVNDPQKESEKIDEVFVSLSSDVSTPQGLRYSVCDCTARYVQFMKNGVIKFWKSPLDFGKLPVKSDLNSKTDHSSYAWAEELQKILLKFTFPITALFNKNLKNYEWSKIRIFNTSIVTDNANSARAVGRKIAAINIFCICHRIFTAVGDAIDAAKKSSPYFKAQLEFIQAVMAACTWSTISVNPFCTTRKWRGFKITLEQIKENWDAIVTLLNSQEKTVPAFQFVVELLETFLVLAWCYDRLESAAALMSEPINCLEQLYQHCEIVSPVEAVNVFRKALVKSVKKKVALDGIHEASLFSKLIEPTSISMNFEAGMCGDQVQSIQTIQEFFESETFKHLHSQLDPSDSVLLTEDDLELMGMTSPGPSSQPAKRQKKHGNNVDTFFSSECLGNLEKKIFEL